MGTDYTYNHASVLVSQLPQGSRVLRCIDETTAWDDRTRLLHRIEHTTRILMWQRTKDGRKGHNRPKALPVPGDTVLTGEDVGRNAADVAGRLGIEV